VPPILAHALAHYGAAILGLLVFAMNAGVPVPGHLAYITSVVLADQGRMQLPLVAGVGAPAAFLGSWLGFTIGRRSGQRLLTGIGPRVGLSAARLAAMHRFFERHGWAAVLFMRFVIVLREFGSLFAGMNGMAQGRFLIASAAGAVAWGVVFAVAGTLYGAAWTAVEDRLGLAGLLGLAALALVGLGHVVWLRRRRARS
jgi:membrane protein DedA with SNARE-associated domain